MEQTKERSKWAGRLEVILVMAASQAFFIAARYTSMPSYYIWRFLLLAVLPLAVIPSHPFAYMGFTRQKIGKQLLFGLLLAIILYTLMIVVQRLMFPLVVPDGYRITFIVRAENQSIHMIISEAISIFFSSFPEEILFRGYFQNRLSFFTSSKYARWIIQAVLFGAVHIFNHLNDLLSIDAVMQVAFATVYGLIVGWLYMNRKKTGYTIVSAMTTHVVYNCLLQLFIATAAFPA